TAPTGSSRAARHAPNWTPTSATGSARCRCAWRRRTCRCRTIPPARACPRDGDCRSGRSGCRRAPGSSTRSAGTCAPCRACPRGPRPSTSTSTRQARSWGCPRGVIEMTMPQRADVVVIGAGIVGNSVCHHLAEAGWRDIVLLDKGPLPDPGGSTGHASNFIFPVDHSREITALTMDSMRQYEMLGALITCGGVEVAREPARVEELKRRMASARAWGVPAELIAPRRVAELVPFVDPGILLAGFWTPSVAVVDPLQAGALMREQAIAQGALTVSANTEVTDIRTRAGRIEAVRTDRGEIETPLVVVASGVWSPRIARLAGASIPLTPAVHQMMDVGPIAEFEATGTAIAYPIIRDMDALMYERQSG